MFCTKHALIVTQWKVSFNCWAVISYSVIWIFCYWRLIYTAKILYCMKVVVILTCRLVRITHRTYLLLSIICGWIIFQYCRHIHLLLQSPQWTFVVRISNTQPLIHSNALFVPTLTMWIHVGYRRAIFTVKLCEDTSVTFVALVYSASASGIL